MPMGFRSSSVSFRGGLQDFQKSFFDRDAVMKRVDKAVRKQLSWFGGYVRRVAQNSLKEERSISAPGRPPHTHAFFTKPMKPTKAGRPRSSRRSVYRDSIFYAYDWRNQTVIIGPILFQYARRDSSMTVPQRLEFGGPRLTQSGKIVVHRARPHMKPALVVSLKMFMRRMKGSVKK